MELKERLKKKRLENDMTLEELARQVGVSRQTIQRYESGIISNIPSDKIELLSCALKTTPAYLMGWEDNTTKSNADLVVDILSNPKLTEHLNKLHKLSKEHQQTIYDTIDYWYEKEGH